MLKRNWKKIKKKWMVIPNGDGRGLLNRWSVTACGSIPLPSAIEYDINPVDINQNLYKISVTSGYLSGKDSLLVLSSPSLAYFNID